MKKIIIFILSLCMLCGMVSCAEKGENTADTGENGVVTETDDGAKADMPDVVTGSIVFKGYGTMTFEIYPNKAPQSALNFIKLAKDGFYDGIIVHRLIENFVIQAGAYEADYSERPSDHRCIFGEFAQNGFDNPINHVRGTLSWARPQALNGASTQFFICTGDELVRSLDGGYAAFGMITSGFDVMDAINVEETDSYDRPVNEIMIEKVTIDSDYEFPLPDYVN